VQDVYFLGRHVGFGIALEGALKLKELAYVRAEAYPAGEMKHGPIALIDDRAVVVAIATRGRLWEKVMANIAEVSARGADGRRGLPRGGRGDEGGRRSRARDPGGTRAAVARRGDSWPLQALAYGVARAEGQRRRPPRNLAKVVTVE